MQFSVTIVIHMKRCIQIENFISKFYFLWFRMHLVPFVYRKMCTKN